MLHLFWSKLFSGNYLHILPCLFGCKIRSTVKYFIVKLKKNKLKKLKKKSLPSVKCFTPKWSIKHFMLLFHTTLPPPPLYLSLMSKTTPLPSHSQVLSFHKPKSQSHSSLSGSLAPLISNTSHCWLNLNHHQHQPPIISSTLFYLFIFQSNHSIHYPQSPPPRPPSSTHPLILKSVFFYH